jgi:hypothetical protein
MEYRSQYTENEPRSTRPEILLPEVSVIAGMESGESLLLGGSETHGCVSLNDSWRDDLRKRLPVS